MSLHYSLRACSLRALICAITILSFANLSLGGIITLDDPGANYIYRINQNPNGSVGTFSYSTPASNGMPYSYGLPSPSGNYLTFSELNGLNFTSYSTKPAPDTQNVDGSLSVDIIARPGKYISVISFKEKGAYSFGLNANPTSTAKVKFLSAILTIETIDGVQSEIPLVMNFTDPAPTTVQSKTIHPTADSDGGNWEGSFTIDLSNTPYAGQLITKANLLFDNILETDRGPANYTSIDKKKIVIETYDVPEPSTLLMFAVGVLGLGLSLRKKYF